MYMKDKARVDTPLFSGEGKRGSMKILKRIWWYAVSITIGYVIVTTLLSYSGRNTLNNLKPSSEHISTEPVEPQTVTKRSLSPPPVPSTAQCDKIDDNSKFDCFPQGTPDQDSCEKRGCCWSPLKNATPNSIPHCYYPKNYALYKYTNVGKTKFGLTAHLESSYASPYPDDVKNLKMDVIFESETRLRVKIYDADETRYETPYPKVPVITKAARDTAYTFEIDEAKGGFKVIRKSNQNVIFNNVEAGGFTFADQFLQLSAFLPTNYIYGLGVQRNDFLLDTNWNTVTMFNRDQFPINKANLYSSHPFFMGLEEGGLSYGVLLLNGNAMDVVLQPSPAITYRTIGGILDFYFFLGPEPNDVIQQFTDLVGKPAMPPYWSLGFHLCRWGYKSLDHVKEILKKNEDSGVVVETQWLDIDYMHTANDFTLDKEKFGGVKEFVEDLHKNGQRCVVILDPGVSASEPLGTYPPYYDAKKYDVLVKDDKGEQPFVGKVWNPVSTVFIDFTSPNAGEYWLKQVKDLYDEQFKFDGLWIDMNEPSNDVFFHDCPHNRWEEPPYLPHVTDASLKKKTICMSAKYHLGLHYNVHNIHAMAEAVHTYNALTTVTRKRPFILSRASFTGQGKYSGVWSGDNAATWDEMYHSIPDILNYNIQGIPMVGADICGFVSDTTKALCRRWFQLGAFYPFSRSHNIIDASPQDPASLGQEVVDTVRKTYLIRYTLLPYLYTLFWKAHIDGHPVVRPLFFEYPHDVKTYTINKQFLWGPAFHIIPVLEQGATHVIGYLPKDRWFDYYTNIEITESGLEVNIPAPLDKIPLFLRGGHILPTQKPSKTTNKSRENPFGLIVVPNETMEANGVLFWDDGESIDAFEKENYITLSFVLKGNNLHGIAKVWNLHAPLTLGSISVLGVKSAVSNVAINGETIKNFTYNDISKHLSITMLKINLSIPFNVTWS